MTDIVAMWSEATASATAKIADDFRRAIFLPRLWPGMTREEWWDYYDRATRACSECKNTPFSGGPSSYWTHAEHQSRMGYRVSD